MAARTAQGRGSAAAALRRVFGPRDRRAIVLAYLAALILFAVGAIASSGFSSSANVASILTAAALIGVAALGQTFVILGAGIDLSIPYVVTFSAIFVARLADTADAPLLWGIPLTLLLAALFGCLNGIGVAYLRISPIIMTLATGGILSGLLLLYTSGVGSPESPPLLIDVAGVNHGFIRWAVVVWAVLGVAAAVVLSRTVFGRRLYAVGTSPEVSRFSGVPGQRVIVTTYAISAMTGAITGMLLLGLTGQAFLSMGQPYLFSSIAAVAIGGTSILGGTGSYTGTAAGALIVALATALMPILNLSGASIPIVYGAVILIAVTAATGRLRAD